MTREEIIEGLKLLEDNMVYFDELLNDKGEYIDVHELLFEAIKALEQELCEDAISREDALQALCRAVHKNDDTIPCSNQRVSCLWNKTKVQDYAEEILKLPPVTPKPKTGHWITQWNVVHQKEYYYCSECREEFSYDGETGIKMNDYNFCPACGVKMESEG